MRGDPKQKRSNANASRNKRQPTLTGKKPKFDSKSIKLHSEGNGVHTDEFGNKETCPKCAKGASCHKAHKTWCPRSKHFNMSPLEIAAAEEQRKGIKKIKDNASGPAKMTQNIVNNFWTYR